MIKNSTLLLFFILLCAGMAKAQSPLMPYTLTPASGTVESLQQFELVFPDATTLARNTDFPGTITITSSNKDAITGDPIVYPMNGLMNYSGNKLIMTTASAIKDEGKYVLIVPPGYLLVDGEPFMGDIGATYTINMLKPSLFPAEGRVESIETIKATFFPYTSVEITDIKPYLLDVDKDSKIEFDKIECKSNAVNMSFTTPLSTRGTYRLVFPAGSVKSDNGVINETAFEANYIIGAVRIQVSVSPAPGTYNSLPEVTITFGGAQAVRAGFNYSNAPNYEKDGTKKMIFGFSVSGNQLTLRPNITDDGTYKVNLRANSVYLDNELHDQGYSWTYVVDKNAAIDGISHDEGLWDVYGLDGVKIATGVSETGVQNTLSKGIYIMVKGSDRRKIIIH